MSSCSPVPKKVRFAPALVISSAENVCLTREEAVAVWYTRKDMRRIETGWKRVLRRQLSISSQQAACLDLEEDEETSLRGLENIRSIQANLELMRTRASVKHAVLTEQRRQLALGIHDPKLLSDASQQESQSSREKALTRGANDASEASRCEPTSSPKDAVTEPKLIVETIESALSLMADENYDGNDYQDYPFSRPPRLVSTNNHKRTYSSR